MEINMKASVVAFYISKFNEKALEELGYKHYESAFKEISEKIGAKKNYIKRRRDEFDVFFPGEGRRKGQRNRVAAKGVMEQFEELNILEFDKLTDIVNILIEGGFEENNILKEELCENKINGEKEIEEFINFEDQTSRFEEKMGIVKKRIYSRTKIEALKELYNYRCQICGKEFQSEYGVRYMEAHHIAYFSKSANNSSDNLVILCPNHHRIIHELDPIYNIQDKSFVYENGKIDKIKINIHL